MIHLKDYGKLPESASREACCRLSLRAARRNQSPDNSISNFKLLELWENKFVLAYVIQFVVLCYSSHKKLIHLTWDSEEVRKPWTIWSSLSSALSSLPLKGWITWTLQCILVQLHISDPISKNTAQYLISAMDFSPGNLPYSLLTKEGWPLCEEVELFFAKELPLWKSSDKIATSILLSGFSLYQHLKWPLWEELVLLGKQNEHLFCQLP